MKKNFLFLILMLVCVNVTAQTDVTTFLGMPVDGAISDMKRQLLAKGFVARDGDDDGVFEGEFFGGDVVLFINTYHDCVNNIALFDKNLLSAKEVKIRFNNLIDQFRQDKLYHSSRLFNLPLTAEDEVKDHPQAVFYQKLDPSLTDFAARKDKISTLLKARFSEEEIEAQSYDVQVYERDLQSQLELDELFMKLVWFQIFEKNEKFFIGIFFENKYNSPSREEM